MAAEKLTEGPRLRDAVRKWLCYANRRYTDNSRCHRDENSGDFTAYQRCELSDILLLEDH